MVHEEKTEKQRKILAVIVSAPTISLTETEKAGETLLKFYRALGWNGEDILNPCKVRTTEAVYKQLYDLMYEKCPDAVSVGMTMVNIAPGVDKNIPANQVYLYDGWITPSSTDQQENGKIFRFMFTAVREYDGSRLHLLNRDTEYNPWVICWNYDEKSKSWDWGTYCNRLNDALITFLDKYSNYGFNRVIEGYAEYSNKFTEG